MKTNNRKRSGSTKALKRVTTLVVLAVAAMVSGCVVHEHGYVRTGARVRIEPGHICTGGCNHYYNRKHWYHAGHVHGPGCGHAMRGGVWIVLP